MLGIQNTFRTAANIVVTNSAVLVTTNLTLPIAANQIAHVKYFLFFSVGASGGVRVQIQTPAAVGNFLAMIRLSNNVAPSITTTVQTASAAFTNALANAGNHNIEIEFDVENGVNAGSIDLQIAQNTADANSLTLLKGSFAESFILQ